MKTTFRYGSSDAFLILSFANCKHAKCRENYVFVVFIFLPLLNCSLRYRRPCFFTPMQPIHPVLPLTTNASPSLLPHIFYDKIWNTLKKTESKLRKSDTINGKMALSELGWNLIYSIPHGLRFLRPQKYLYPDISQIYSLAVSVLDADTVLNVDVGVMSGEMETFRSASVFDKGLEFDVVDGLGLKNVESLMRHIKKCGIESNVIIIYQEQ